MTTQASFEAPPRSPTIVGSAVETIVWSSAAISITSISAPKTGAILVAGASPVPAVSAASVIYARSA